MRRHITLVITNYEDGDIDKLNRTCEKYHVDISNERIELSSKCYFFTLFSDNETYRKIEADFGKKFYFEDLAALGVIADCDDQFLEDFSKILEGMRNVNKIEVNVSRDFARLLNKIDKMEVLDEIATYDDYFNDRQLRMLERAMAWLKNGKTAEELVKEIECGDMKELLRHTDMTMKQLSEYLEVPYRTLQDWVSGKSKCASYVFELIRYRLINDHCIIVPEED